MNNINPYNQAYILDYGDGDVSLESKELTLIPVLGKNIVHSVLDGETLQNIAFRYYGNSGYWYRIAMANNMFFPFRELEPGTQIIIP